MGQRHAVVIDRNIVENDAFRENPGFYKKQL